MSEKRHSERERRWPGREKKKHMVHNVVRQCTLLWFFTWWLTHVYYHMRMTKPITSQCVAADLKQPKNFHNQFRGGIVWRKPQNTQHTRQRRRKCPQHQSQFITQHSLLVTGRDGNQHWLLQAGLSIHVWQEAVKLLVERFVNKEMPLIIVRTACKQWKVRNQVVRLLFIPVWTVSL